MYQLIRGQRVTVRVRGPMVGVHCRRARHNRHPCGHKPVMASTGLLAKVAENVANVILIPREVTSAHRPVASVRYLVCPPMEPTSLGRQVLQHAIRQGHLRPLAQCSGGVTKDKELGHP